MKRISILSIMVMSIYAPDAFAALAAPEHLYANGISARNIGTIQHSITARAFQSFDSVAAAALGARAKLTTDKKPSRSPASTTKPENPYKTYGHAPVYGTMKTYGEWNDDGTATRGRSGGDNSIALPAMNSAWLDWQHYDDKVKFDHFDRLDSDYDLIMLGASVGRTMWRNGVTEWGFYTGYVGGSQENDSINIDEKGGYIGLYSGYTLQNFHLSTSVHGGALSNDAENIFGTDEYSNMWAGAALKASYVIEIDDTFTLQPEIYGAYTWVKSANYTADSDHRIDNDNFNIFEVTPGIRAIKHIANGWFATATAKYVMMFENGGTMSIDGVKVPNLDGKNYSEYGLGLEKSINRFNISINLGRRDGGYTGWHGGVGMKYLF